MRKVEIERQLLREGILSTLQKSDREMSGEEIMLKISLEDKDKSLEEDLLRLSEQGVIRIPTPSAFRFEVWNMIDNGEVEFTLDRKLKATNHPAND